MSKILMIYQTQQHNNNNKMNKERQTYQKALRLCNSNNSDNNSNNNSNNLLQHSCCLKKHDLISTEFFGHLFFDKNGPGFCHTSSNKFFLKSAIRREKLTSCSKWRDIFFKPGSPEIYLVEFCEVY